MIAIEPGPIPLAIPPAPIAVFGDPIFAALGEADLSTLPGYNAVLDAAARDYGAGGVPNLDGDYDATIGYAADVTSNELRAGVDGDLIDAGAAGEGIESYRQSVLPNLPPPEVGIDVDFEDPPALPPPDDGGGNQPPWCAPDDDYCQH
jgi:hypothetical protein